MCVWGGALARENWKAGGRRTLADLVPVWSPLRQCAWFGKGRGTRQPQCAQVNKLLRFTVATGWGRGRKKCRAGGGGKVTHDPRKEGRSHIHKKDLTLAGQSAFFLSLTSILPEPRYSCQVRGDGGACSSSCPARAELGWAGLS